MHLFFAFKFFELIQSLKFTVFLMNSDVRQDNFDFSSNFSKVAGWLQKLFPPEAFILDEKAWNAFPYCKTVVSNPDYMKDKFFVRIESLHVNNDRGTTENIFNLPPETLKLREVVDIDITINPELEFRSKDYKLEFDPRKFKSAKTARGPLGEKWFKDFVPVMCCYKLVTLEFKWMGLQLLAEKFMHNSYPKLFGLFNREVFCLIDEWIGLKIEDIRRLEDDARKQLDD
uniref:Phosphatidylinositol transfer protein n=1 Tax=Romanomermis culicivorax TaxID=13658 RepID=A0A915JUS0_ROMCU